MSTDNDPTTEMYLGPSLGKIAPALIKARMAMTAASKTATNPHFKTKYADLSAVMDACVPQLLAEGIMPLQQAEPTHDGVCMRTTLLHSSGEWVMSKVFLPATKQDPQAYGSAITYARRYGLAAIVCLAAEDDDGEAMRYTPPSAPKPAPASGPRVVPASGETPSAMEARFVAEIHGAPDMKTLRDVGAAIGTAKTAGHIDADRAKSLTAVYLARQAELLPATGTK